MPMLQSCGDLKMPRPDRSNQMSPLECNQYGLSQGSVTKGKEQVKTDLFHL